MTTKGEEHLRAVYSARGNDELRRRYDAWAETYDDDLRAFGYTYPALIAGLVGRYVHARAGPILDAGAGTGIVGEVLAVLGYDEVIGIDLSDGMLRIAASKGVYAGLDKQVLGERLDFPDARFAATVCAGVLTIGHAPPESLDEMVRVTRPGGHLVFTLTEPSYHQGGFGEKLESFEAAGRWRRLEVTRPWFALPKAPAETAHPTRGYAYLICDRGS